MTLRLTLLGAALAAGLLLAGCGDDQADQANYAPPPDTAGSYRPAAPPAPALPPVTPTATADDDPLAAPDPMAPDGDSLGASAPLDDTPPHDDSDPMLGRAMPTEHSHWLNVEMFDARVTVRLNGIQIGSPSTVGTTDITMRLHRGPNFLAVTCAPRSARAWAAVTVTEGEHHPAVAPLVTFRQAPQTVGTAISPNAPPPPTTKTFTFIAH